MNKMVEEENIINPLMNKRIDYMAMRRESRSYPSMHNIKKMVRAGMDSYQIDRKVERFRRVTENRKGDAYSASYGGQN